MLAAGWQPCALQRLHLLLNKLTLSGTPGWLGGWRAAAPDKEGRQAQLEMPFRPCAAAEEGLLLPFPAMGPLLAGSLDLRTMPLWASSGSSRTHSYTHNAGPACQAADFWAGGVQAAGWEAAAGPTQAAPRLAHCQHTGC